MRQENVRYFVPGMQYKCLLQFFGLFLSYLLMHMYNNLLLMLYVRSMLLYKYTCQSNDIHILIFTQSLFMHLFLSVHESYFFYEKKKVQLNCQLLDCQFMGRKDSYCELSPVWLQYDHPSYIESIHGTTVWKCYSEITLQMQ